MKLMTYNILDGAKDRLELVINAVKRESPDYLTINEANTFAGNNNKILKYVAKKIGLPYFNTYFLTNNSNFTRFVDSRINVTELLLVLNALKSHQFAFLIIQD